MLNLNCSSIAHFAKRNAFPLIVGAALGYLGRYVVSWLGGENSPFSIPKNIEIIQITGSDATNINAVSLSEFKKVFTVGDLNQLRKSVGWQERTEKIWKEVFEKSTSIVCVKKENQLVGFGCFVGNGRMGTIFDIHIHPDYQKQKIGTLLMNHLVKQIKTGDYTFIGLFAWEENQSVLEFYKKFGFTCNPHAMQSSSKDLSAYIG